LALAPDEAYWGAIHPASIRSTEDLGMA